MITKVQGLSKLSRFASRINDRKASRVSIFDVKKCSGLDGVEGNGFLKLYDELGECSSGRESVRWSLGSTSVSFKLCVPSFNEICFPCFVGRNEQRRPSSSCRSDNRILDSIRWWTCSGGWVRSACSRPSTSGTRRVRPTCASCPTRASASAFAATDPSSSPASTADPSLMSVARFISISFSFLYLLYNESIDIYEILHSEPIVDIEFIYLTGKLSRIQNFNSLIVFYAIGGILEKISSSSIVSISVRFYIANQSSILS